MEWLLFFIITITTSGWLLAAHDLRAERRLHDDAQSRLDLLRKAISAAHAGIFHYKVNRNESFWDVASLRMFGQAGDERIIAPGTWEALLHPEDRERALSIITGALNGDDDLFNHVYRISLPDGSVRWIEGTGFIIRDRFKHPIEVTGFHFDITKKIEYEESLKSSESRAVHATQAKTQFLANMSHEIRTPMNAIVGMIDLLNDEKPTKIQQRYLATLQNSSDVLLRIINDILDVSKIEAGKLTLERKAFNLREVISQCIAVYAQMSDHKNVLLTGWVAPEVPLMMVGGSTRLQQVIMNLIGNAFKFTPEGHILLRVQCQGSSGIHFSVTDTGIGISDEAAKTLFERFSQADISTTRKFGGTGLGLTIVKEIIELWGGHIKVESNLGKGSVFTFILPSTGCQGTLIKATGKYLLCTRHEPIASFWRQDHLAPPMVWAKTMDEFKTALAEQSFDHLIVEQRFPQTKGIDLIRLTKQHNANITCTLVGFEKYVKNDQWVAEVDRFLARPFIVNQLWDTQFITEAKREPAAIAKWPDYSHIRLLCVDDNQSNLMVLAGLLKRFGIVAQCVDSGTQAIAKCAEQTFDLILMDYEMPEMDGPETTRRILHNGPAVIVALSAHTGDYFKKHAEQAGMKGFLMKPIRMQALALLLAEHVSERPKTEA